MERGMKKPPLALLFPLVSLTNTMGLLYAAALPFIPHYFQITKAAAQQTVSFYVLGALLAYIVYAPLSKAIGRKPALYIGCGVMVLGSLLCLAAIDDTLFPLLLLGRTMTAFGAASGLIISNIMIADTCSEIEKKKALSTLMASYGLIPPLGVLLGGLITTSFSWAGCFYFMLFYAVLMTFLCFFLPETGPGTGRHHLHVGVILKSYYRQVCQLIPFLYTLIVAAAAIVLYLFAAEAPFIATHHLKLSPSQFGLYNLIPSCGFFVGGLTAAYFNQRLSSKAWLLIGGCGFFLFSLLMWWCFDLGLVNALTLFGIPVLIFIVSPALLSHGQSCTVQLSEDRVYACSFLYVAQCVSIFLGITALRAFAPTDPTSLPILYSIAGLLMLLFWIIIQLLSKSRSSKQST
jgi:MFS family permease